MSDRITLQKAAQFSDGLAAALLRQSRGVPGLYRMRTVVRHHLSRSLRSNFGKRGYIYHETNFIASRFRGPTVVTVHDLSHRRHPSFHPQAAVNYLDHGLPRTLKQAQTIIADSVYTKQEILDIYDVPEEKVVPIYLGVEPSFRTLRRKLNVSRCWSRWG